MNCHDFRRKWDELLDAETPAGPTLGDWEDALREHAAGCNACRQLAARYHVLLHALRAWVRAPRPSADLSDRILAAASTGSGSAWAVGGAPSRQRMPWRLLASAVAAAVAVALVLPVINRRIQIQRPDRPRAWQNAEVHSVASPETGRNDHADLQRALAEATSATWDLARSASEPAARISRDMLDATLQPEEVRSGPQLGPAEVGLAAPISIVIPPAPGAATASAVLQRVGDHLAAGVRPLSSTARHAFGFLLGEGPDRSRSRASRSTAKGA
jgi:hypothetical protein